MTGASTRAGARSSRSTASLPALPAEVDAIAVCLLHSDLDAAHEHAVAAASPRAAGPTLVVCSHEVSPEFREYERMVTTVVEAFLEPVCAPYLERSPRSRPRRS